MATGLAGRFRPADRGMLVKVFDGYTDPETLLLHSDLGVRGHVVSGNPGKVSTAIVEKNNQTLRQCVRRLTRRTNAHSKKAANHAYALALHFAHYHLCRIHQSLRVTPAMAAGVTDRVWEIRDLAI